MKLTTKNTKSPVEINSNIPKKRTREIRRRLVTAMWGFL